MENKQQFSEKNPLRLLYIIDQSGSTYQEASDENRICNHFAEAVNVSINDIITNNRNGADHNGNIRIKNKAIINVTSFSGDGVETIFENNLSELFNSSVYPKELRPCLIKGDLSNEEFKLFITPKAIGNSPLGLALETMYKKCLNKNEFYHKIIILSDALIYDKERDNDLETAMEFAELFKKQGSIIQFAHMSANYNMQCVCPVKEDDLIDETSKIAFNLASEISDDDLLLANTQFGMHLKKGAKMMLTNGNPLLFNKFIRFGSNSNTARALPPSCDEVVVEIIDDKI